MEAFILLIGRRLEQYKVFLLNPEILINVNCKY